MNWCLNPVLNNHRKGAAPRRLYALVVCLLLLCIAFTPLSVQAQGGGPQYTVQTGDTLYAIALNFGTTVDALLAANPTVNPNALAVGQVLIIPGLDGIEGAITTHTVELGESLASLALRFGVTQADLVRLNRLVNPEALYINQPLTRIEANRGDAIPTGTTFIPRAGEGLLSLSLRYGQSPWALALANQTGTLVPTVGFVIPGGDAALTGLPFPLTAARIGPLPTQQGRTVAFSVQGRANLQVGGALGDWPLVFHAPAENPTLYQALLGIPRLADPNLYLLTIAVTDTQGATAAFTQRLGVRSGDYGSDLPLTVDPETIDPAVTEPEFAQLRALTAPNTPTKYWTGIFQLPSVGALRSYYGSLRSYNGGPYDSFHTGTDFSGAEDRPITAPAPGVVVFAGPLTVRGNATVIDHGWGVYTGYWHQSVILVTVGQKIETGAIIGYQGATGRVTGPHLHWEMWVGGTQVNPLQWTEEALP